MLFTVVIAIYLLFVTRYWTSRLLLESKMISVRLLNYYWSSTVQCCGRLHKCITELRYTNKLIMFMECVNNAVQRVFRLLCLQCFFYLCFTLFHGHCITLPHKITTQNWQKVLPVCHSAALTAVLGSWSGPVSVPAAGWGQDAFQTVCSRWSSEVLVEHIWNISTKKKQLPILNLTAR